MVWPSSRVRLPAFCVLTIFATGAVRAETSAPATPPTIPVYETTVTALRLPRPLPDVPGTVTVIPRDEIDRTPAIAADDVLRVVPSAATFRRTPSLVADPTSQGLNLRGVGPSGVSRALVLVDGIPANDPFGGWIYWRSLPRLGIERMEVAPGGTSALYGNFALGGVLHFFMRPVLPRLQADVSLGSLDTRAVAIAAGASHGRLSGAIELEGVSSDGYVPVAPGSRGAVDQPADSRHGVVNGRLAFAPTADTRIGLSLRLFDERANGGTTFTTARVRTADAGVTLATESTRLGRFEVAAFAGQQRFRQERARIAPDRSSETRAAEQYVPSNSQGASAVWTSRTFVGGGNHVLVAGTDLRRVSGAADESLFPPQVTPTSITNRRSGGEQRFVGLFLQELYAPQPWQPWLEFTIAGRIDVWQNRDGARRITNGTGNVETTALAEGSAVEFNPRFGFLLRPSSQVRFRGTAYRAFRAPTLNELYRPFQVGTVLTAANADLAAERLVGADLGVEALLEQIGVVRLTGFWNRLVDPIVNATLPMPVAGAARQRKNLGQARIHGVEASTDLRLGQRFVASAAYTLAEARVTQSPDNPALLGNLLPQDPIHRGRVSLAYLHPRAEVSAHVRAQGQQFEDDANQLPMAGFVTIDLFASIPIAGGVAAFASVQNLLDERYLVGRAGIDTIGPPLMALAGLRLR
jgi:iron complex outermembrane receptor protein